jgi:hypothetical protein
MNTGLLTEEEYTKVKEIVQRWHDSTTGNWIIETDKARIGENWKVCSLGNSCEDGLDYYITTNRVRVSEYSGDAKSDAEMIVNAKPDIEYLGRLVERLAFPERSTGITQQEPTP